MMPSASAVPILADVCAAAVCFGSGDFGAWLDFLPMDVLLVRAVRAPGFRRERRNDAVLMPAEQARHPHLLEAVGPGDAQRMLQARRRPRNRQLAAELVEGIGKGG